MREGRGKGVRKEGRKGDNRRMEGKGSEGEVRETGEGEELGERKGVDEEMERESVLQTERRAGHTVGPSLLSTISCSPKAVPSCLVQPYLGRWSLCSHV